MLDTDPGHAAAVLPLLLLTFVLALFADVTEDRKNRRPRGGIGRRIAASAILASVTIVLQAGTLYRYVATTDAYGPVLELAGRQRFLAQGLELLVERMATSNGAADEYPIAPRAKATPLQESLEKSIQSLDDGLRAVEERGAASGDIAAAIREQKEAWGQVRPLLLELLPPSTEPLVREASRDRIRQGLSRLVDSSSRFADSLEDWRNGERQKLLFVLLGVSLGGLATVVLSFKSSWDHVVSPVRRLRDTLLRATGQVPAILPENEIEAASQAATALASDISHLRNERARMSEELRRVEADYQSIFENAVAGILRFDGKGRILLANGAIARMLGYSTPEELKRSITDVHRELFADPAHRRRFEELQRKFGRAELEGKIRRRDGTTVSVLESASAAKEHREPKIYETVIVDVTPLKRAQESLRQLSGLLLRSQDQERRRLARELHDSTGQLLAALEMNLGRLNELVPVLQETLSSSMELASESGREIRSMSYLLHPPMLEELGLLYAIRDYSRGFSQRSGVDVAFETSEELGRLDADAELALFRVVQEALTNIHRHSGSPEAVIRIILSPHRVGLEVEDHGCGIPPELLRSDNEPPLMNMGVGMRGMEERLRQLGGQLAIESRPGRTVVRAELPFAGHSAPAARLESRGRTSPSEDG